MIVLIIKWIKRIYSIVSNYNVSPGQIGAGVAMGIVLGITPFNWLVTGVLLGLVMIININPASAFLVMGVIKPISALIDPLAEWIGWQLLVNTSVLKPLFTILYNMPIVPFTRFNNTIMLGSFVIGIVVFLPVKIAIQSLVRFYRRNANAS